MGDIEKMAAAAVQRRYYESYDMTIEEMWHLMHMATNKEALFDAICLAYRAGIERGCLMQEDTRRK